MLRIQAFEPGLLIRTPRIGLGCLCHRHEERKMPALPPRFLTALQQPVPRVLAHGLQESVAGGAVPFFGRHQALIGQRHQQLEHCAIVDALAGAHLFRGFHCPAASEYRRAAEQRLFGRQQQIVTPVQRRAQRLLARLRRACAAGEQSESIIQPRIDLLHRQRANARRRQLQRQRYAVEPDAQLRDRRGARRGQRETGLLLSGPLDEQLYGL